VSAPSADQAVLGALRRELVLELARREFWEYCRCRLPALYHEGRPWLRDLCVRIQAFWEGSDKSFLVVNLPPRHCKSLTGQLLTEWVFGRDPTNRVMTCSYNERLATVFAKRVRDAIQTPTGESERIQFADVFPGVSVSKGDAAADMWRIEGSPVTSYLATSPGGTATGMGCNLMFVDDLVKNDAEALNDAALDAQADWFFHTMLSRLEGDWKVVVIMQRWSTRDIAGRVLESFDCEHVEYPAYTVKDGVREFLCPEILDEASYEKKTRRMASFISDAIYLQHPVDVSGRLYRGFNTYRRGEVVPTAGERVYAVTDTADRGTDFLCSLVYVMRDDVAFVLDCYMSDAPMEVTEDAVARMFERWGVTVAFTEANNGGRLFARNVRRRMGTNRCVFSDRVQTRNKEARILESSGWVQNYVWFPEGWERDWPEFSAQVLGYNAKGRNAHDDAVDDLANLYDMATRSAPVEQHDYPTSRWPEAAWGADADADGPQHPGSEAYYW
jgi:predicted phage terminase large subunit-like protein